jgi:hypothetical protein
MCFYMEWQLFSKVSQPPADGALALRQHPSNDSRLTQLQTADIAPSPPPSESSSPGYIMLCHIRVYYLDHAIGIGHPPITIHNTL